MSGAITSNRYIATHARGASLDEMTAGNVIQCSVRLKILDGTKIKDGKSITGAGGSNNFAKGTKQN